MESNDIAIIERNVGQDAELKALWDLHRDYEERLEKLSRKPYLTPSEEVDVRELKKKKLAGKTKLQAILDKYK
ncbi:DUF465 domain-containing protein [Desulfohalovibrio reitneri]|uniref:DUF465 domain-containing protein n=1 Tax=Desulfohalovibrio reitneri TaxID=1307759 RepID=UPI0004A764E2|nr:DUF465 domain-containing protein [Desulfohalovibrio reitneri]